MKPKEMILPESLCGADFTEFLYILCIVNHF